MKRDLLAKTLGKKRLLGVPTGSDIRNRVKVIIGSSTGDRVTDLASYIIRVRNEALRSGKNRSNSTKAQEGIDSACEITVPVFQANLDALSFGEVLNFVKQAPHTVKLAAQDIAQFDILGVVKSEHGITLIATVHDKSADVGYRNNFNSHTA